MKLLAELLPLAAFFTGYQIGDIFVATMCLMAAAPVTLILLKLGGHPIETVHKATFAMILVFGGLTLAFDNKAFIQWKTTFLNFGLAAALLVSVHVLSKNPIRAVCPKKMKMDERGWLTLAHIWVGFFAFMGALNTALIHLVSEQAWVNAKTFAYPGLSLVFCILQGIFIYRRGTFSDENPQANQSPAPAETCSGISRQQAR